MNSVNHQYERIASHVGHQVEVVAYGDGLNVAVECIDCGEVITDEHREPVEDDA